MEERGLKARNITLIGLLVNALLAVMKFIAGYVGDSKAVLVDAFHTLSDIFTDIIVLVGLPAADKPVDRDHDYGHGKIETLISLIIGLALLLAGGKFFWSGALDIVRVSQGEVLPAPKMIALAAAVLSVVIKFWLFRRTIRVGKAIQSQAIIANAWDHQSDALSSIAVILGVGGAILLGEKWRILDPLTAIVVSIFIFRVAFSICWESVRELLEESLGEQDKKTILEIIQGVRGAEHPHNLRTRKIGRDIAVEVHIRVDPSLNIVEAHDIATRVEGGLKDQFGPKTFISVHVEPEGT